ncbi:MAG: alpha/beta fold hydrolase [Dehalococcoidia bacterium]|nr:alpha/beta fold hydrolase [Dehalococcoidia bacterium]
MYRFDEFELDLRLFELRHNGAACSIEPQVFDVLSYLVRNHDRMVPKDELIEHVWPEKYVSEAALASRVMAARKVLGDTGREQRYIKTIHGRGFRFVGNVRAEEDAATGDADNGPAGAAEADAEPSMPGVQYAQTRDGYSIAYSVTGQGPPLIRVLGWFTHIDMEWRWAKGRRFWERLAQRHTLVRYDGRGMGLSQPAEHFSTESRLLDLEAVIEATGFERFALLGMSEGVYAATHYAARHPERVTHLITYGGGVSSNKVEAAAWEEQAELFVRIILQGWGSETPAYRQLFANLFLGPGAPPEDLQYFCEMQRVSAPANRAAQYLESLVEDGVEESARAVHVPTMVVHRPKEALIPFSRSQRLAALIPGARLRTLDGDNHWLLIDDAGAPDFVRAIEEFIGTRWPPRGPEG